MYKIIQKENSDFSPFLSDQLFTRNYTTFGYFPANSRAVVRKTRDKKDEYSNALKVHKTDWWDVMVVDQQKGNSRIGKTGGLSC